MKTKKMLAVLFALTLSASVFAVPAMAEDAADVTEPTETVSATPSVDYDAVYTDYVYNTLLPKKSRAALDITFNTSADVASITGVVSTAIYDFGQDGVKELVVVTREEENAEFNSDERLDTGFYLNVYRADEKGNVALVDRVMTPEYYFASTHGVDGDGLEEVELFIYGNAVYLTQSTTSYGSSGPDFLMHEYAVYDFSGDKFSKYEVAVSIPSIYDITGLDAHSALDGSVLYTDADLKEEWGDIADGEYTDASEVESILTENFHADVEITKEKRENEYQNFEYLTLDIQAEPAVKLMHFTGYVGEETPYQTIEAAMIAQPAEKPTETESESESETEVLLDYYDIYYNFVYNILIPDVGRAARTISSFNSSYDIDKLFGVVSTTIYDFDDDGIDELFVITREEVYDEDGYSRTYYNDTDDWGAYTTFRLYLYQADDEGNVNLLDSIATEEHTVSSYPDNWYEDVQMVISGDCIYEEYVTHKYASSGSEVLCHEYVFYDVSGGQFSKSYKLVTDGCSVWEGNLGDDLLYYDDELRANYNMTFSVNPVYSDSANLSNVLTQYLADNFPINFTYAEIATGSEKIANFIDAPQYLYLDIDVVPAVTLMHYQFSIDEDANYQTMGATMLNNPLRTNDDDDDVTTSIGTVSSSSSLAKSSSPTASSSSNSSSTQSPNTSDKLPVAAGLTGLAALAAGFFARRKNKG